MKNVVILGAGGNIAQLVADILNDKADINLTLFLRSKRRLQNSQLTNARIIEGDVLNYEQMKDAIDGKDIVYANLAGDLDAMAKNIVRAMEETGVKRIVAISSIGIYENPLRAVLKPYRALADTIEASGLDYTIIRPAWFTSSNEVDYELTRKGEPEKGSVISMKSLASFIAGVIESPDLYSRQNLGINKPNS